MTDTTHATALSPAAIRACTTAIRAPGDSVLVCGSGEPLPLQFFTNHARHASPGSPVAAALAHVHRLLHDVFLGTPPDSAAAGAAHIKQEHSSSAFVSIGLGFDEVLAGPSSETNHRAEKPVASGNALSLREARVSLGAVDATNLHSHVAMLASRLSLDRHNPEGTDSDTEKALQFCGVDVEELRIVLEVIALLPDGDDSNTHGGVARLSALLKLPSSVVVDFLSSGSVGTEAPNAVLARLLYEGLLRNLVTKMNAKLRLDETAATRYGGSYAKTIHLVHQSQSFFSGATSPAPPRLAVEARASFQNLWLQSVLLPRMVPEAGGAVGAQHSTSSSITSAHAAAAEDLQLGCDSLANFFASQDSEPDSRLADALLQRAAQFGPCFEVLFHPGVGTKKFADNRGEDRVVIKMCEEQRRLLQAYMDKVDLGEKSGKFEFEVSEGWVSALHPDGGHLMKSFAAKMASAMDSLLMHDITFARISVDRNPFAELLALREELENSLKAAMRVLHVSTSSRAAAEAASCSLSATSGFETAHLRPAGPLPLANAPGGRKGQLRTRNQVVGHLDLSGLSSSDQAILTQLLHQGKLDAAAASMIKASSSSSTEVKPATKSKASYKSQAVSPSTGAAAGAPFLFYGEGGEDDGAAPADAGQQSNAKGSTKKVVAVVAESEGAASATPVVAEGGKTKTKKNDRRDSAEERAAGSSAGGSHPSTTSQSNRDDKFAGFQNLSPEGQTIVASQIKKIMAGTSSNATSTSASYPLMDRVDAEQPGLAGRTPSQLAGASTSTPFLNNIRGTGAAGGSAAAIQAKEEGTRKLCANKKADVFDAVAAGDSAAVQRNLQIFWPLFDAAYIEFVQNWLKTKSITADLSNSPLQNMAKYSIDRIHEIVEACTFGDSLRDAQAQITEMTTKAREMQYKQGKVAGRPGGTSSAGDIDFTHGTRPTSSFGAAGSVEEVLDAPMPIVYIPRDFDFLPIRERQLILHQQGVLDNEVLKNPRLHTLASNDVSSHYDFRSADGESHDDFPWSDVYSANPNQPFNVSVEKSGQKYAATFEQGGDSGNAGSGDPNGTRQQGEISGVGGPKNGIALHQALTSMSWELRMCQETLAAHTTDASNKHASETASYQAHIMHELTAERDYWKKECTALWEQVRRLESELHAWTDEGAAWAAREKKKPRELDLPSGVRVGQVTSSNKIDLRLDQSRKLMHELQKHLGDDV